MAQLQQRDPAFVLKGGAAAQLFLDSSLQRGSRDIDVVTSLDEDGVHQHFAALKAKFDGTHVEIKQYVPPEPPNPGLPLITYEAYYNSVTDRDPKYPKDYIKLDVLMQKVKVPTTIIEKKATPCLIVQNVICITLGALIGDKLLTLASQTIGTPRADEPKQLYDIDNMMLTNNLTEKDVSQISETFVGLAEEELRFKGRKEDPMEILDDIISTLTSFSKCDLIGDRDIKTAISNFQSVYVRRNGILGAAGWSTRALRVRFLAMLLKLNLEQKAKSGDLVAVLAKVKELSTRLSVSNTNLRGQLLRLAGEENKALKGAPLLRLFWAVVSPSNIDDLAKII